MVKELRNAAILAAVCLTMSLVGAAAKEAAPDGSVKPGTPATGQRLVATGTIKMQCPGGTDKYCDGNKCGCWTRND